MGWFYYLVENKVKEKEFLENDFFWDKWMWWLRCRIGVCVRCINFLYIRYYLLGGRCVDY